MNESVKILKAYNSPKQIGLDKNSVEIQMKYLLNIVKDINAGYFYSSEDYGKCVADYMKIENRLVDKERVNYPISGTKLRKDAELQNEWALTV